MTHPLLDIPAAFHAGRPVGITSVCSAHPLVIEAALRLACETGRLALIEATCNQVNQDGGYTGMTPEDFRTFVEGIADKVGLARERIIFGGDHLGPNPWKDLPADEAMEKAEVMIAAFAAAGFTKLHLDCSMGCAGEPVALPDAETADRAARLAARAEAHRGAVDPVYVIGTEVPVPGGALEELDELAVTTPDAAAQTYEVHRAAFDAAGLQDAFARVIALVVQPGVEFGHTDVIHYVPKAAEALSACLRGMPGLVFEAHSTDYQTRDGLSALVRDGFAILKVGPWLTFALREALYGLDAVADVLDGTLPRGGLMTAMDEVMRAAPGHWSKYYDGTETDLWLQRHFSYSDRIRYYWPRPQAQAALRDLMERLSGREIPDPVLHQYVPAAPTGGDAEQILVNAVQEVLRIYERACTTQHGVD
ncbi:D-tagatose-bisphosphate aldolase, class II, non-catalytic subunit [Tropicimonas sp. IMCC6043]|uniref:D-tagatose-bisphosphate aldolase, class II, non-catalytic subunit n=1 Tax=Tropicimonas sp. IMCC6043 TaxID=2510645 RepID=UPI00101DFD9E|nr:D-tagatose-bisphosphate aldolase, class II, non-catalytic subunit [Tropicimonas sp. IMCC6043]RYH09302.1 D-tagatose-bisphosphate aldolase, class II, non-catalytic subunit [Tropicimonas sp. IMCC6043]